MKVCFQHRQFTRFASYYAKGEETDRSDLGMLSAFMAFIEPGDEVIIFEPFFDQ